MTKQMGIMNVRKTVEGNQFKEICQTSFVVGFEIIFEFTLEFLFS